MTGHKSGTVDIVRIIARLNVGGPARHVIGVNAALAPRYSSVLVYGDVADDERDMSADAIERGLNVMRIPQLGRRVRVWHDLVTFLRLVGYLRKTRPRIVHTHTAKAGTLGRLAAFVARVPVRVHTYHGHVFEGYFSRTATRIIIAIERALARITTRIIAISPSQARDIAERFRICDRARITVVSLGLQLERFAPERIAVHRQPFRAEVGARPDDCIITIVGRLAPIKNHDLLLDAAKKLLQKRSDCLFLVVGDGSEAARLKEKARMLDLQDRVRFLGWRSDLEAIYAGSDIVVLTSDNEGTPVSLIEALAAGRAVVATDVGGVSDLLENGKLGVLVPPRDANALAHQLAELIDNPHQREELARPGPASMRQRFSLERLAEDLTALYDELLANQETRMAGHS